MKKLLAMLLALACLCTLCACQKEDNEEDAPRKKTVYVLTREVEYDASGAEQSASTYAYDDAGRMKEFAVGAYTYQFDFDDHGIPKTTQYKFLSSEEEYNYSLHYDDNDQLVKYSIQNYPRNKLAKFTLSYTNGRLTTVTDVTKDAYIAEQYTYDVAGCLTQERFFDGNTLWVYDFTYENGLLKTASYSSCAAYADEAGQIVLRGELFKTQVHTFCYDAEGRLIQYDIQRLKYTGESTTVQYAYQYDENGYPISRTCISDEDGQNPQNVRYTCDEHGNIIKKTYEDGSYVEYTYEEVKMTAKKAKNYCQYNAYMQLRLSLQGPVIGNTMNYIYIWRYLAPNVLSAVPYAELLNTY